MATKTISIELDVYEKLRSARLTPKESFSQVLRRAKWDHRVMTGAELISLFQNRKDGGELLSKKTIDRLDEAQQNDLPPRDKWNSF